MFAWWLGPAGRLAAGTPRHLGPAAVSGAGSVRPSCPPPVVGLPYLRGRGLIRHPRSLARAVPVPRRLRWPGTGATAAPRCQPWSVAGLPLPCLRPCRPYGCGVLPSGASGASPVLVRRSACRPRPADSGGPAPPRLPGGARMAGGRGHTRGVRHTRLCDAVPALPAAPSPRRPTGVAVDASPICFAVSPRLRHGRQTRDGWGARPCPTRTFTWSETPRVAWRDNARPQARRAAGAQRKLEAVACTPWFGAVAAPCLQCLYGIGRFRGYVDFARVASSKSMSTVRKGVSALVSPGISPSGDTSQLRPANASLS